MSSTARARANAPSTRFSAIRNAVIRRPVEAHQITIEKAKLRVVLDQQLGRETPQSVKDLAKQDS
ncbi:hypothetical protein [Arthrobacter sp. Br18]|uniref:hypothetical protein n=1 Tax=Arthrobacter sp. Br18 TaxID=1312954 RepID=UPI0012DEF266|nr:hypothetical protein [Arthrobacter sp. Br18]